ncbi:WD40-like domain containing protein [Bacteroides timonensis]|uniref:WD40-like domain containing protein n=1 Tax=Bacteroides timonensis TaxID=1470345 RepID=UPI0004B469F9|nr:WD40-like domain containing protein [Bacteroides timonensis]
MKKIHLFLLLGLLLAACDKDKDKDEQPIFVTDIVMPDPGIEFTPGDKVTIKAQGFQTDDDIMLDIRWPLVDQPLFDEGYARGVSAVITEKTATSITLLAPGHYPASTTEVFLRRSSEMMSLGKIAVKDGQSPEEFQLYGIVNSKSNTDYPYSIEHIERGTGKITRVEQFTDGKEFSCAVNISGSLTLCGIQSQGGNRNIANYDLSMNYWKWAELGQTVTLCTSYNNIVAIQEVDPNHVSAHVVSSWANTRSDYPAIPSIKLPDGMKSEALARYPGVIADSNLLLSADNGNGTFSPVVVDLGKHSMHALAPLQSTALIPFWIMVPVEDAGSTKYTLSGGYAVVTDSGTEFRLWNTTTMSMAEPFATSPDYACSIATHMKDANTQELYVLSTGRSDQMIGVYDILKKEWNLRLFPGVYPYSEIVLAR